MNCSFNKMDESSARDILGWRYDPPYDVYNLASDEAENVVKSMMDPQNAYFSITDEQGELVAYCCFGREGQVPGGDYSSDALDIGMGVRPDLTGRGLGQAFANRVLDFADTKFSSCVYRVTVAGFNERALRVWEKAGFQRVKIFQRYRDKRPFVILVLPNP
ncbi:GNAT family N-acetyltransferase [Chloroflexota bacterium]